MLEAAAAGGDELKAAQSLRRQWGPERAAHALEVALARVKAGVKFGPRAAELLLDRTGVEQATSARVAAYKAERIAATGLPVCDLGSGVGADSMALRKLGLGVIAIDRDPARAFMTACNAGCPTAIADAAQVRVRDQIVHLDPARRTGGERRWKLDELEPGPATLGARLDEASGGVVKLGPGLDLSTLPFRGELEVVSEGGRLVALHLWTGTLEEAARRATLIDSAGIHRFAADAPLPIHAAAELEFDGFIHTVDPSIERLGLMQNLGQALGLSVPHSELGLLTGPQPMASPWLQCHELLEVMPFREKRLRAALRQFESEPIVVKTRGQAVSGHERFASSVNEGKTEPIVVFLLRDARRRFVLITRRLPAR